MTPLKGYRTLWSNFIVDNTFISDHYSETQLSKWLNESRELTSLIEIFYFREMFIIKIKTFGFDRFGIIFVKIEGRALKYNIHRVSFRDLYTWILE